MRRESWSVESTIGLLFTIIIAILALAIVSAIRPGRVRRDGHRPQPAHRAAGGDHGRRSPPVHRARTGERVDAMSCDLIDPHTGGVAK